MSQPKILYISQEITPYLPSSAMADICNRLPRKSQEAGYEVRLFMPKYGNVNERRNQLHEVIRLSGINLIINDTDHPLIIKVATLQATRMQVYFIDNDDYFERHPAPQLETTVHADENGERTVFFVRGVAETVKKLRWDPVIIHCSGWLSALAAPYIKRIYSDDPSFRKAKVVYSLFDDAAGMPTPLDAATYKQLRADGISDRHLAAIKNKEIDHKALSRLAIDHADAIIQAEESADPELVAYAAESGKPFLSYPGDIDTNGAAYIEFYRSLTEPTEK